MNKESYTLLDNRIWEDENLSHAEFRVLSYLIRKYSLEYGYSFPLREQIINKCHVNPKTLNKVLNSLEERGYITRKKHKTKNGWNNIYYIHKYLVVSKKAQDLKKAPKVNEKANEIVVENGREQLANELLVKQSSKVLNKQLKTDDIAKLNALDTDILIKAIDRANKYKSEGYYIGYLFSTYESIKNNAQEPHRELQSNKTSNNSTNDKKSNTEVTGKYVNNNYPVKTKYHQQLNEHFRNYEEDELERKLLEAQARKRGLAI